jgi:flagella basal body P-ring formation protein FlgA
MRHVTKIAVLSILVMVASVLTVSARVDDATIIDKVRQTYDLDSVDYQIEILSNTMRDTKETDGDRKIASGQVRLRISRFMDVVVVNDKIKRHAVLTDDLFAVKRMDVTTLREQPITSINDVLGLRAKRNLKLGQILTSKAVELIPDVEPGREVAIVYTNGLCRISATGVVMQEGMAGDYIKVKNKSSGKMVIARVVDHGAVVVDL